MNPTPPRTLLRNGMALHLILALLLSVSIMTMAWVFGSSKAGVKPSFLLKLKADYQMESAILLNFHRLKTVEANFRQHSEKWNPKQELAPGITLKSGCRQITDDSYKILTYVEGPGFSKFFSARAFKEPLAQAVSASGTDPLASPALRWGLEFLPNQGEKL